MFKRKHYRFLLDWAIEEDLAKSTCARLAARLEADNPAFDRERFLGEFYSVKNGRAAKGRMTAIARGDKKSEPRIRPNESFQDYADRIKSDLSKTKNGETL